MLNLPSRKTEDNEEEGLEKKSSSYIKFTEESKDEKKLSKPPKCLVNKKFVIKKNVRVVKILRTSLVFCLPCLSFTSL